MNAQELLQKIEQQEKRKVRQRRRQHLLNSNKRFYKPYIRSGKGKTRLLVYKQNWNGHTWIDVRYYVRSSDETKSILLNGKWFQPTPNGIRFTVDVLYDVCGWLNQFFCRSKIEPTEVELGYSETQRLKAFADGSKLKFVVQEFRNGYYFDSKKKVLALGRYQVRLLRNIFDEIAAEDDNLLMYERFRFRHWFDPLSV